jgi:tyrosine-specific transport protein
MLNNQDDSASIRSTRSSDLYAVSVDSATAEPSNGFEGTAVPIPDPSLLEGFWLPVLSAACLITGNTVGASMLVLPDMAAGPGMGITSGILLGAYCFNLISGLAIAQVAIQQHESSGNDVPSSFKEFAEVNLPFASAANVVSGISVSINSLMLAFDTTKAGQIAASISGLDVSSAIYLWAAVFAAAVSTQSLGNLSRMASILVVGLFASFAGLLLPGLAHVTDPIAVLTSSPAASVDVMESVLHAAPVVLTTLVYQNVVPSVTRVLDYDRTKTMTAIALGSFVPLIMYLAWCVVVLGGGITTGVGGSLMTVFSLVTVAGSSLGALISLSEEFQMFLGIEKGECFALPSVVLPAGIALLATGVFASDINDALKVAGSFGSPLLYGIIPVAMAWCQQQRVATSNTQSTPPLVPGGMVGLGALGLGAVGLVGSELTENLSHLF